MTTTLRVIVDEIVTPASSGVGRHSEELTRALIATAPRGCEVSGVVAASAEAEYDRLRHLLPGMADLFRSALGRRELQRAWQHGITKLPGSGMVHSSSMLAPLFRHDRVNDPSDQTVVTLNEATAWTHPQLMNPRDVAWTKAVAKRAARFADAIVVPSHAVATDVAEYLDFGERLRVIGGGVGSKMRVPVDADARSRTLDLPPQYILYAGTLTTRRGLVPLIRSLRSPVDAGLPLILVGRKGWGMEAIDEAASEISGDSGRIRFMANLDDADLSVVMDRATVFAYPALSDGFGLSMLEAFHFGTPVVHSDAPAAVELAAGAGITASSESPEDYPDRLAEGIARVVGDPALAERLGYAGQDRAAAFTWEDSAQRVWQLHADL